MSAGFTPLPPHTAPLIRPSGSASPAASGSPKPGSSPSPGASASPGASSSPDASGAASQADPTDSDGEGISDVREGRDRPGGALDSDGDGQYDFLDIDADNDGFRDGAEDRNHNCLVDPGETSRVSPT